MNKYEITFIVRPDIEEAEIKSTALDIKKVLTDNKAKVVEEKEYGQKELAYEVAKHKVGYYFFLVVESDIKAIEEFTRVAKINEKIIRHLVIKVEE